MILYRSEVGKLNWLSQQTRPDLSFNVSSLSQACKGGTAEDEKTDLYREKKKKRYKLVYKNKIKEKQ